MSFDFFRVDWILIDGIISILLIIVLIGVNVIKKWYRWRLKLSNEALERIQVKPNSLNDNLKMQNVKKWTITYSKVNDGQKKHSTVIILRKLRKFMLFTALTEGLSTYGFNVINVWSKSLKKSTKLKESRNFSFSDIINYHNESRFNLDHVYRIVSSSQISLEKEDTLLDDQNDGVIMLNRNIKREEFLKLIKLPQVYAFYSERLILFWNNPYLTKIKKLKDELSPLNLQIKVIKGAKASFRYYETILLTELINCLESNQVP